MALSCPDRRSAGNTPDGTILYYGTHYGLSTDPKPTNGVFNGSQFVEMDTSKLYFFSEEGQAWIEFGSQED